LRDAGISALAGLGLALSSGCGAVAQAPRPTRLPRVGYLTVSYHNSNLYPTLSADPQRLLEAFQRGLVELGYVDGQTVALEPGLVDVGKESELPAAASELARKGVDVIVAAATTAALAAKQATTSVPIVFVGVADPVLGGLVASVARPGGNATGLTSLSAELGAKRLDLLKEAFPTISRLAVLWSSTNPTMIKAFELQETQIAARLLGVELTSLEVPTQNQLQSAYEEATRQGAQALLTLGDLIGWTGIISFASRNSLPTMSDRAEFVFAGGLMAYAPSFEEIYRRAAVYVDKILRGARPAELPVERPKRFQLLINLQTARTLGFAIPPSVLSQADQAIPVLSR
jgi:putative ABC transport system substrate-binding protein